MPERDVSFVRSPFVTRWWLDESTYTIHTESEDERSVGYILPTLMILGVKYHAGQLTNRWQSIVSVLVSGHPNWIEVYKSRANFGSKEAALNNARAAAEQLTKDIWRLEELAVETSGYAQFTGDSHGEGPARPQAVEPPRILEVRENHVATEGEETGKNGENGEGKAVSAPKKRGKGTAEAEKEEGTDK